MAEPTTVEYAFCCQRDSEHIKTTSVKEVQSVSLNGTCPCVLITCPYGHQRQALKEHRQCWDKEAVNKVAIIY